MAVILQRHLFVAGTTKSKYLAFKKDLQLRKKNKTKKKQNKKKTKQKKTKQILSVYNENESDLYSYEHFLRSSENKA